jgi:hypothetical protein
MKIIIHSPPDRVNPEEKKRFLSHIQSFRIPFEKTEEKDRKQFLYFRKSFYKYSRTDPELILVVEKWKQQSLEKKGKQEGPWEVVEIEGDYFIHIVDIKTQEEELEILPLPLSPPAFETISTTVLNLDSEYHPSRFFASWNLRIQRVHRQFSRQTPFPIWCYNIQNVHRELGKTDWLFQAIEERQK